MKRLAQVVLQIEPLLVMIIIAIFWFPNSTEREWALLLFIPPMIARLVIYRRLWAGRWLNWALFAFLALCAINTYIALGRPNVAPYSWGWWMMGRPLMGVGVALSISSMIYERGSVRGMVFALLLLALLVGSLGLGSAQYLAEKTTQVQSIIDLVPRITGFPGAEGGFNVNEIGGAMAFFAPFAIGIAFYEWRVRAMPERIMTSTVAFLLLGLALFLGQSRLAIFGVLFAIGALIFLLIPLWRWRLVALAILIGVTAVQVAFVTGFGLPSGSSAAPETGEVLNARDADSVDVRFQIWNSALSIIRDHPLTGVGLNMFRANVVRDQYPAPGYGASVLPHAHNELLQVGSDTGIPGMLLYLLWHGILLYMLVQTARHAEGFVRATALSAGAGLVAHAVFGLGDAIALFDRFIFAYWLLVGIVSGAYLLTVKAAYVDHEPSMPTDNRVVIESAPEQRVKTHNFTN